MSDEMKCCPFGCNGDLFVVPDETGSGGQHVAPYHAGCSICKAERLGETMEAAIAAWNTRRPTPEQSRETREQLESARRVLKVLDDEASKRRQKYGSAIYSARDVDPDVYDIAKRIIDRAAMDRSALGRDAENTRSITADSAENGALGREE